MRLFNDYPGETTRLRPEQIAHQSTWTQIPDAETTTAALSTITIVPKNGTTVTYVNPLDPGTDTGCVRDPGIGWDRVMRVNLP